MSRRVSGTHSKAESKALASICPAGKEHAAVPSARVPAPAPRDGTAVPGAAGAPRACRKQGGDWRAWRWDGVLGQRPGAAGLAASRRWRHPALVSYTPIERGKWDAGDGSCKAQPASLWSHNFCWEVLSF